MRIKLTIWLVAGISVFGCVNSVSRMRAQSESAVGAVQVESLELTRLGTEQFEVTARMTVIASRPLKLRALVFDRLTIGGVPVQAPAMDRIIELKGSGAREELPPLQAAIAYRDLGTLEPLRRAIADGRAKLQVDVRAQLQLNLFEKLALHTGGPWIVLRAEQDVPVDIPGGALGKLAAMAALMAAEPIWIAGQQAEDWRRGRSALAAQALTSAAGRVVSLRTHYAIRSSEGKQVPIDTWCMGFLTARGKLLAPAEAMEPWMFDDAQAQALASGDVKLQNDEFDVIASLLGEPAEHSYSLRSNELRLIRELHAGATGIALPTKRRYSVRFRNNDANAALFDVPGLKNKSSGLEMSGAPVGEWQTAALLRLDTTGGSKKLSVWVTEARFEDGRYVLRDAADDSAIGSPLWVAGGAAGLMQDSRSAASVDAVLRKLR